MFLSRKTDMMERPETPGPLVEKEDPTTKTELGFNNRNERINTKKNKKKTLILLTETNLFRENSVVEKTPKRKIKII